MATTLARFDGDGAAHPEFGDHFSAFEADLPRRIAAISRSVGDGQDLSATLTAAARAVVETSRWPMCGVELFSLDGHDLLDWSSVGFAPGALEVFEQWPVEGNPSVAAARQARVIAVPDVSRADEFPYTRREAIRTGFRSAIYVPVRLPQCWAVVAFCRPDVHTFSDDELDVATSMASSVSVAVASALALSDGHSENAGSASQRHAALHDRLLRLQVGGASVADVCRGVADALRAPVLLVDRFARPLVTAGPAAEQLGALAQWVAATKPTFADGVAVVPLPTGDLTVMVQHCGDGDDRLGTLLVLVPPRRDADPALSTLIIRGAEHARLALIRQRMAVESEVRMRQEFGEALGSMAVTGLGLTQLAAVIGIDVDATHEVMRVHPEGLGRPLSAHEAFDVAEILTKRLASIGVTAVVSPVGGVDFVLVLRDQPQHRGATTPARVVRSTLRDALQSLRPAGRGAREIAIGIGMGNAGTGADGLDRSHREAKRALEVAIMMDGADAERHIADVGSYAVLAANSAVSATDQSLFVRRYLEPLMEYDQVHNAGYVQTLRTYFETVGNVQRTADKLFLHLSTVRYRLKRIEEIAQVDLREEEDRLCMQLALRLARFDDEADGAV
ncbi:helix-turn-helix domain-containing protein [Mycobacterium sp. SMC-4]|uniref:helix-turn-helix domain-containing protein n=1 Tax=Mycobacterium sp. SMC-4 TaxID=2857059 RepID=UPI003D03195E